jgi:hypothetical protein
MSVMSTPSPTYPTTLVDSWLFSLSSQLDPSAPEMPADVAPADYEPWLRTLFRAYFQTVAGDDIPFAERHHEFWRWVWALQKGVRPAPFVGIWCRGGGKSTNAEMACVALGARKTRRYALYISSTKDQADDHVANVASLLESRQVERYYPLMAERALGKYGNSKGWRRNRLRTASGFTVDALGLDVAARGVKLEDARPDVLIFDDFDDIEDSETTIAKKVNAITKKLLPAGSSDVATLVVQNMVHHEGVMARLAGVASVEADFLADRIISGPHPALTGFKAEREPGSIKWRIVTGEPTWEGQNLETCQLQINDWGIKSFRSEAQHERTPPEGQAFPEWDPSVHVIEPFTIPDTWPRLRAVDYGWAVPFCQLWGAKAPDGTLIVYLENYGSQKTAGQQATEMKIMSSGQRFFATVGDPAMWAEQREGKKYESVASQYAKAGVKLQKATNARIIGWSRLHDQLDWAPGAPPKLRVFKTCTNLIRTLPLLVRDPNKPEDVDAHADQEDHAGDCLRYMAMAAPWLRANKVKKSQMVVSGSGSPQKHPLDGWIVGGVWNQRGPEGR